MQSIQFQKSISFCQNTFPRLSHFISSCNCIEIRTTAAWKDTNENWERSLRNNLVLSFVKNLVSFWQSPFFLGVVYNFQYSGKKIKWAIAHFRKRFRKNLKTFRGAINKSFSFGVFLYNFFWISRISLGNPNHFGAKNT